MKFPRWLSWMFVLVLAYMIYAGRSMEQAVVSNNSKVLIPPINDETYPALAATTDIERWKRALDPEYASVTNCTIDKPKGKIASPLMITQEDVGTGVGAACGEKVNLELTLWDAKGIEQFSGTVTLALGSRELASGLDKGLLGMKRQAVRTLLLPAYARVHGKSKPAQETVNRLRKLMQGDALVVVRVKRV